MTILEACVDSAEAAVAAARAGAGRVELCANLVEGGTTPSAGSIRAAVVEAGVDVMVMIRPRGGDFVYSPRELEVMRHDIMAARDCGAHGVVFGCLTRDGVIDRDSVTALRGLAAPLPVTFHRAFDVCRDPFEALDELIELGINRLLTSGQQPTAPEGLALIGELVDRAADRIVVMPGVGIDAGNVRKVALATGAREFHVYTERTRDSEMRFRREDIPMGREYSPNEYMRVGPDPAELEAIARALSRRSMG